MQRDSSFAVKPLSSRPKTRATRLSEAQLLPLAVVAGSGKVLGKACSSCVKLACTRRVLPTRLVKPMLAAAGKGVRSLVFVLVVACGLPAKYHQMHNILCKTVVETLAQHDTYMLCITSQHTQAACICGRMFHGRQACAVS